MKIKIQRIVGEEKENLEIEKSEENVSREKNGSVSELRRNIITGDWVVIAVGRVKRPEDFSSQKSQDSPEDVEKCLFCDPQKSGQEEDILLYEKSGGDWTLRVFPNKFPAFSREGELTPVSEGPYFAVNGVGFHEVLVTRDHNRPIALMEQIEIAEIFDAFQERYLDLMHHRNINFIAIFQNHGREAGASIVHPHAQIMAIPVLDPNFRMELDGAKKYHKSYRECVFCTIIEYEREVKRRIVFENEDFLAFCPFASRAAFEIWVTPKKHMPYFERITDNEKLSLAEVFGRTMRSLRSALNDPAYNFYIHTAPCDGRDYPHFHWHIEILPKTSVWAGFELETGIEISTVQPEKAAEFLRKNI